MTAYYNEIDPFAAQWLRNLIAAGHIAPGDVDERSIADVQADDLVGYDQCHFFAGIGGWSYALRLAGWPDDKPVWTGSCPCQPFSCAGQGKAFDDARHLWPEWFRLIRECRPATVFGEQVDAAVRWGWFDLVQSDLEAAGYACGAAVIPAAGIGAPHIRHRLWFVGKHTENKLADAVSIGRGRRGEGSQTGERGEIQATGLCGIGRMEYAGNTGLSRFRRNEDAKEKERELKAGFNTETGDFLGKLAVSSSIGPHGRRTSETGNGSDTTWEQSAGFHTACGMADTERDGYNRQEADTSITGRDRQDVLLSVGGDFMAEGQSAGRPTNGFWADADWLFCRDGKQRPVEPSLEPLAHRPAARMGRLRAYGNAIVPQVAATFIRACM